MIANIRPPMASNKPRISWLWLGVHSQKIALSNSLNELLDDAFNVQIGCTELPLLPSLFILSLSFGGMVSEHFDLRSCNKHHWIVLLKSYFLVVKHHFYLVKHSPQKLVKFGDPKSLSLSNIVNLSTYAQMFK